MRRERGGGGIGRGVGRGGRQCEGVYIGWYIMLHCEDHLTYIEHMVWQFSVMCLHGNLCMFVVERVREWGVYCDCNIL